MTHDELLRLIDQAADEGWTSLDLSNKGLTELSPEIGKLINLTELHLRYNQCTMLPSEIGNLKRLTKLDLGWNQLSILHPEIGTLTNLTWLFLRGNQLITLPSEIWKLTNLMRLDLESNQLTILPQEIGNLIYLIRFNIGDNQLTKIPSEIGELKNLKTLGLESNKFDALPSEIWKLTGLIRLNLSNNQLTMLSPQVGNLINLTFLSLRNNQLTTLPPEIENLINLTTLDLRENPLPIPRDILISHEPAKIISSYLLYQAKGMEQKYTEENKVNLLNFSNRKLTIFPHEILEQLNLTILDLRKNQISMVPPEITKLRYLKELSLQNNQLDTLPLEIGKLINLQALRLGGNQFTNIPVGVWDLMNIVSLDFEFNKLTQISPEIKKLSNLKRLYLKHNQLTAFPTEICELANLTRLELGYNQITNLPPEIEKLTNLKQIELQNNRLSMLPSEIRNLKNLIYLNLLNNPLPIPPEILELSDQPQKILNYYFQHVEKPKKPINEAKVLIVGQGAVGKTSLVKRLLEDEFNPYETKTDGIAIKQWHVKLDEADIRLNLWDFGGQEIMHATHQFFLTKRSLYLLVLDSRLDEQENRVEYWLKMIQSFGGDSPILVVCNKCDEHDLELNWKGLQDKYPTIRAFARQVSCKTGAGIAELRNLIEQEAGQLPHIHDELILSWFAVKTELEEMPDDYISYNRYRQICANQEVDDELSQQTLLGFLHDLGIVLHFHDHPMLEDTNVLNPEWVTRGVYQLLNSNELFQSKGELERRELDRILDPQSYPRAKHQFILDMMRKFELCFDFAEYAGERFLVPDLLSKEEPYTGDWEDSLGFQYHYDILPGSVMSRFIVRMHAYIFKKTYWRHGVVLVSTDGKNKALVKADLEERKIFIHVAGRESTRYMFLEIIRADLHKIHKTIPKLKVKEKVLVSGHPEIVVDYEHLLTLEELGEEFFIPEGLKIKVSVRQLLHGIQPQPTPGPSQEGNLPHTYFLSYSWKNSSEVDHLELVLNRNQRTVLRDETNIEAGGRVSISVEQMIQQADTFVALWNEHYAQSTWCPNELEYARNRQAKGQKPSRIVLIALDDTDVPIRFIDTLRLNGQDRAQRELAIQRLIKEEYGLSG